MANTAPLEIIAGPIEAWVAPHGTAYPATPAVAPGAGWVKLGTSGDDNITEDGLTIRHTLENEPFYVLGRTLPRKTFNNREGIEVEFNVADATLEVYSHALGGPATAAGDVVDVPAATGVVGYRKLALERGFDIYTVALLVRCGISPYGDGFNSEWRFPAVQQNGEPELVFVKDVPIAHNFRYMVIADPLGAAIEAWFQDAIAI